MINRQGLAEATVAGIAASGCIIAAAIGIRFEAETKDILAFAGGLLGVSLPILGTLYVTRQMNLVQEANARAVFVGVLTLLYDRTLALTTEENRRFEAHGLLEQIAAVKRAIEHIKPSNPFADAKIATIEYNLPFLEEKLKGVAEAEPLDNLPEVEAVERALIEVVRVESARRQLRSRISYVLLDPAGVPRGYWPPDFIDYVRRREDALREERDREASAHFGSDPD